ncbi:hypothetical protein F5B20DRAFT_563758 [Whalleya microplaca]|nr:hypothetical protein F5B20DRAFT_563758 [Whalleya microplaca]
MFLLTLGWLLGWPGLTATGLSSVKLFCSLRQVRLTPRYIVGSFSDEYQLLVHWIRRSRDRLRKPALATVKLLII